MTSLSKLGPPRERSRAIALMVTAGLVGHVVAICLLAYLASARVVEAAGVLLYRAGMAWTDATVVASMTGFLIMLLALLWLFSRRSVPRTWLSVGVLSGLSVLAGWMAGGTV